MWKTNFRCSFWCKTRRYESKRANALPVWVLRLTMASGVPVAATLPPPAENELAMLDNVVAERKANSRLCCQIKMTPELAGLVVRLPDAQS